MSKQTPIVGSVPKLSTGAESASNTATGSPGGTSSTAPTGSGGAPVVAPKGFRLQLQQMLAGCEQVLPAGSAVPSRGGVLAQATVSAQLEGFLGSYTSQDSASLALETARSQAKADRPAAKALLALLKEALTAFFGSDSPQLARFGLKPKKANKAATSQKLAIRAAKAKNTRAIRGTMGSVQKADKKSGPLTVSFAPAALPVAPNDPTEDAVLAAAPPVVVGK